MEFTNEAPERRFGTQEEAEVEADALNADLDCGQAWQATYVNEGFSEDDAFWIITLEDTEVEG